MPLFNKLDIGGTTYNVYEDGAEAILHNVLTGVGTSTAATHAFVPYVYSANDEPSAGAYNQPIYVGSDGSIAACTGLTATDPIIANSELVANNILIGSSGTTITGCYTTTAEFIGLGGREGQIMFLLQS